MGPVTRPPYMRKAWATLGEIPGEQGWFQRMAPRMCNSEVWVAHAKWLAFKNTNMCGKRHHCQQLVLTASHGSVGVVGPAGWVASWARQEPAHEIAPLVTLFVRIGCRRSSSVYRESRPCTCGRQEAGVGMRRQMGAGGSRWGQVTSLQGWCLELCG